MAFTDAKHTRSRVPGRRAFTLVELLVVLLILAILLGLVVGISKYIMAEAARKQTVATQRIVMNAIERYQDATGTGEYPNDSGDCKSLMTALKGTDGTSPSAVALRDLPEEAWEGGSNALKDGFGEDMKYEKAGGLGGTPVIISKGPDREFGNPTGNEQERAKSMDNIRSDK